MKASARSLVLLIGCCLGSACSDKEPASSANLRVPSPATTKVAPAAPPSEEPATALTASAPSQPSSVLTPTERSHVGEASAQAPAPHAPEPEPEPIDFSRTLEPEEVKIDRFVLAHDVQNREPIDEADTFASDADKIVAFVQLANGDALPYAFTVHFEPEGGPAFPYGVQLNVPTAPRHRTWAWTRIKRAPGAYRAVLRTLDGEEIASRSFTIAASDTAHAEADDPAVHAIDAQEAVDLSDIE